MIKNSVPIPIAEMKSESLRPKDSAATKMKKAVAMTFTTPYIPEARRESDVPVYPIDWKIVGA